jgi:hypothetical protein
LPVRDRIVELRRVPAKELAANPRNWRKHPPIQQQALRSILDKVGMAGALLARETPDGLELIDGHLRKELLGQDTLPVLVLDVDEDEAKLLLATLDPLGAMATVDEAALLSLLEEVVIPDEDLERMLGELQRDPRSEWEGMPGYENEDRTSPFQTVVHFATEEDMHEFFESIGHSKSFSFWWPESDGLVGSDMSERWVAGDAADA